MSKLQKYTPSSHEPEDAYTKDLDRALDDLFKSLLEILNSGLLFSDNFSSYITSFTTNATPGVETAIAHGLKRVPTGFLVFSKNKAAHIFNGASGKDATNCYIQSDVASVTVTVMIF